MASTNFVDNVTPIVAEWLNEVNTAVFTTIPTIQSAITAINTALTFKVDKTSNTGSAVIPTGTTAERDGTPLTGYFRYNTSFNMPESWTGTAWKQTAFYDAVVKLAGDTMTGALNLFGDATNPAEAVPKQQLDSYFSTRGWLTGSITKTAAQLNVSTLVPGNYFAIGAESVTLGLPSAGHYITHTSYSTNFALQVAVNKTDASLRYTRVCNSGVWGAWIPASGLIALSYNSGEQSITAGGGLTLAHGLGTVPKLLSAALVCKVAEAGYAIGDVVYQAPSPSDVTGYGVSVRYDSTNLYPKFASSASVFYIMNKTTGAATLISLSNWKIIFYAYA